MASSTLFFLSYALSLPVWALWVAAPRSAPPRSCAGPSVTEAARDALSWVLASDGETQHSRIGSWAAVRME